MNTLIKAKHNMLMVQAVLNTDPITNEEGLKSFLGDWLKATPKEKAAIMSGYFNPVMDAQAGHELDSVRTTKNFQALGTYPTQRVGDFMTFANELTQDMNWMPAFRMMSTTAAAVDIVDFASTVTVTELQPTQKIEVSPLGTEAIANLREKRFGAGVNIADRWLETNGIYTLNTAIEAIRQAFITFQGNFAYALLAGSASATQTVTAATVAAITTGLNTATDTLIAANANQGFNISPDSPILFYLRHTHKGLFDQVLRNMTTGPDSDSYLNLRLTNMVIPVYTYNTNFPTQFAGKNAGMLVLPGRKNVWVNYKAQSNESVHDFSSSSMQVLALQNWNAQAPAAQRLIVNLEA